MKMTDKEFELNGDWWQPRGDKVSVEAVLSERWKVHRAIDYLKSIKGPKLSTAVQAGGHVGIFPTLMAEHFESVYTFEPDARNFRCMGLNVRHSNVITHRAALFQDVRRLSFAEVEPNNSGSVAVDRSGGVNAVRTMTIDDLRLESCDLIYLDIEGCEGPALMGGMLTIKRHWPLIIVENKGLDQHATGSPFDWNAWCELSGYRKRGRMMRDDVLTPNLSGDIVSETFWADGGR